MAGVADMLVTVGRVVGGILVLLITGFAWSDMLKFGALTASDGSQNTPLFTLLFTVTMTVATVGVLIDLVRH